jgi:hypothetical protein
MKKKSTARLPPDDDTLNQHVEGTNYITYCQLHYNLIEHPSPIGHGWGNHKWEVQTSASHQPYFAGSVQTL